MQRIIFFRREKRAKSGVSGRKKGEETRGVKMEININGITNRCQSEKTVWKSEREKTRRNGIDDLGPWTC